MIRLSPRDRKVLDLLAHYELMSSPQIRKHALENTLETNYFRRMRALEKEHYVRRIGPMLDHSYAWMLGRKGKDLTGLTGIELFKNRLTLEHDITLTDVRMTLDALGLRKNVVPESRLRREAFENEKYYGAQRKPIIVPDALITVEHGTRTEVYALELELTFKNRQRYFELFKRYRRMSNIFVVWYLVPKRIFADRILNEWAVFNQKFPSYADASVSVGVTVIDAFLTSPMTATIRGNHREFTISEHWKLDHRRDQSLIDEHAAKVTTSVPA